MYTAQESHILKGSILILDIFVSFRQMAVKYLVLGKSALPSVLRKERLFPNSLGGTSVSPQGRIILSSTEQMRNLGPREVQGASRPQIRNCEGRIWDQALGQRHQVTLSPQVCPAETLGCFRLELSVIGFEEGPLVGTAVFRLQRLLDALGSRLWVTGQGPCPPCEGHPQRPVPLFLAKLLELLQGACARHLAPA